MKQHWRFSAKTAIAMKIVILWSDEFFEVFLDGLADGLGLPIMGEF